MQCSTNLFIGKTRPLNQCCNFDIIFILDRSICNASFSWVRSGKVLICFASRCQYPAVLELCNSFFINVILNLNFLPCYTGEVNGAASVDVHLPAPYNLSLWLHHGQVDVVPYGGRRRHLTLVDTSITEIRKKINNNEENMKNQPQSQPRRIKLQDLQKFNVSHAAYISHGISLSRAA